MATLVPSKFCRYNLEEQEGKRGQILTTENLWVIQNKIADCAQEKIELSNTFDTSNLYWKREAELQGMIDAFQSMLESHYAALEEALALNREQSQFYDTNVIAPGSGSVFG